MQFYITYFLQPLAVIDILKEKGDTIHEFCYL